MDIYTNDAGDIIPSPGTGTNDSDVTLDLQTLGQITQAVADAYAHAGADAASKALESFVVESAQAYAQAGADALYRHLLETGALAATDRVVVKEVIRDGRGVITAFVERSVSEADLEAYRR